MLNKKYLLLPFLSLALLGCNDSDDEMVVIEPPPPTTYSYQISVTNLTHAQPLSPIAAIFHQEGNLWQRGEAASDALETLAESGDNSAVLALNIVQQSANSEMVLPPGETTELMLTTQDLNMLKFSLISMMVNTNDGFSGLNAVDVSELSIGDSMNFRTLAYDSGTEANSEMAGTVPGPADMGEGFNINRDDVNFVSLHPGVVSQDDGLNQSVLGYQHKFDNPLMAVSITRMQ